jgi:hypothetical protein
MTGRFSIPGTLVGAVGVVALVGAGFAPAAAEFPDDPAVCAVHARPAPAPAAERSTEPDAATSIPRRVPAPHVETGFDSERDVVWIRWTGVEAEPLSEELSFEVAEGVVGLTARAEQSGFSRYVSVELLAADGTVLSCEGCPDAPAVGEMRAGRGTTQMPSTDRDGWELEPGRYSVRVRTRPAEDEGLDEIRPLTVTVSMRSEAPVELDRILDLRFVYLPNCGVDTDYALTSPEFGLLLEGIDKWLSQGGIRLGNVTHVDFDRPEFSRIGTWEDAGRMFKTSSEIGRERALNVYCVERFVDPLNPAVGLSGGIPGPAFNGTRDSGIAIRMTPFPICAPVHPDGYSCLSAYLSLFLHEIGHYLGFWHTTETDLVHEDPFSDTPRCEERDLRTCPDWQYVMFPVIHSKNQRLSPHQIRVMQTHPILRSLPRVGGEPAPAFLASPGLAAEPPVRTALAGPNPFRSDVGIRWTAPDAGGGARLGIWDVTGRRVLEAVATGGRWSWDGRDEAGRPVPAGVYFVRVETGDRVETLRVVRAR